MTKPLGEFQYSYCPTCKVVTHLRWDITHCPSCHTMLNGLAAYYEAAGVQVENTKMNEDLGLARERSLVETWRAAVYAYSAGYGTIGAVMKAGSDLANHVEEQDKRIAHLTLLVQASKV